ncbi:MAG: SNF2-related protein [Chlamydia sp.]
MALSSISDTVLNFRKLKQDFSTSTLREGKALHDKQALIEAKIVGWGGETVDIVAKVKGQFGDTHSCHLELFRIESDIAHSKCDCINGVDCQHIACILFYLERHFAELLVQFLHAKESNSQPEPVKLGLEMDLSGSTDLLLQIDPVDPPIFEKGYEGNRKKSKAHLQAVEQKSKEMVKEKQQQQQIGEYLKAGQWLAKSAIGNAIVEDLMPIEAAEMTVLIGPIQALLQKQIVEIQICLKTPGRVKPVLIQHPKFFFQALYLQEPIVLGSTRSLLIGESFGKKGAPICSFLRERGELFEKQDRDGKQVKVFALSYDAVVQFISLLLEAHYEYPGEIFISLLSDFSEKPYDICIKKEIRPTFHIENVSSPDKAIHVDVSFDLPDGPVKLKEVKVFSAKRSFLFHNSTFFIFEKEIQARHLTELESIRSILFPEALFPTFFRYTLPSLAKHGSILISEEIYKEQAALNALQKGFCVDVLPKAHALLSVGFDNELMLDLSYSYNGSILFPEIQKGHSQVHLDACMTSNPISRNFLAEKVLAQEIGWGMTYEEKSGLYRTKSEKKIVEFFSDVLPFKLHNAIWTFDAAIEDLFFFKTGPIRIQIDLAKKVQQNLQQDIGGVTCLMTIEVEESLDCISSEKILGAFQAKKHCIDTEKLLSQSEQLYGLKTKQLIISPEELKDLSELIQDTLIPGFENGVTWTVPLWVIFGLEKSLYQSLDLTISKSPEIEEFILSLSDPEIYKKAEIEFSKRDVVKDSEGRYTLRSYQQKGVDWMKKMRFYGLSGVLADDMGLGKTLQTISLLRDVHNLPSDDEEKAPPSLIICPTSLVENWKNEIEKFEPGLAVLLFSGTPVERKRLSGNIASYDIVITSYGVLQREIDLLEKLPFSYAILDEAQTIKNRDTRNARSVKRLSSSSRLVLTGTPLENSLEDIWSLFDFLMPGFLGCFERFSSNYIRLLTKDPEAVLDKIRKKIQPFVLRRMKQDVLDDLPSITHQTYFSVLKDDERALYESCAKMAKKEIEAMILKDGFDKARLHVLATISRLKQICCHPRLVRKGLEMEPLEKDEDGFEFLEVERPDELAVVSASKYELLTELIQNLILSNRKTVVFSQYTRMLNIIKKDFELQGIRHLYLDGTTKNRIQLVNQFNEDSSIHVFLVSLRAGGMGLNLTGADTVIHYDPWWNPAVENQATDRVWRMGQTTKVSSYKLIVKGTVEEKIANLQERKKGLIGNLIQSDEEALSRLTYEDVMELFEEVKMEPSTRKRSQKTK